MDFFISAWDDAFQYWGSGILFLCDQVIKLLDLQWIADQSAMSRPTVTRIEALGTLVHLKAVFASSVEANEPLNGLDQLG